MSADTWRDRAACRGHDTLIFFDPSNIKNDAFARSLCRQCPVVDHCRECGDETSADGIWGGLNERERAAEKRRAKRLAKQ